MKLLLHRSLTIDADTLERMVQALLFYARSVTIRAGAVAADPRVRIRLRELVDLGLVRTWAYEYELTDSGGLRGDLPAEAIRPAALNHVITLKDARELMRRVEQDVSWSRAAVTESAGARLYEGISEVVQLRHSLGVLRLTDHLGAGGVVMGEPSNRTLVGVVRRLTHPVDTKEAAVREVVARCRFGPLAHLPLDVIQDCRREMSRFRDFLDAQLASGHGQLQVSDPSAVAATAQQLAEAVVAGYRRVRVEAERRPPRPHTTWDVVGAVLPAAVVARVIGARFEWFRYQSGSRPFVLLGKLARYQPR